MQTKYLKVCDKNSVLAFIDIEKAYEIRVYENEISIYFSGFSDYISKNDFPDFDLLVGGSPCQDLSIAQKSRVGLEGERSGLFFYYVEILRKKKPKFFILENVNSMSQKWKDIITNELNAVPFLINASLVSAQNRRRLFWVNWLVMTPCDRNINLKDILIDGVANQDAKEYTLTKTTYLKSLNDYLKKSSGQMIQVGQINNSMSGRIYSAEGKSKTLCAGGGGMGAKTGLYTVAGPSGLASRTRGKNIKHLEIRKDGKANALTHVDADSMITDSLYYRKLYPIECERLQTFPDDWTKEGNRRQGENGQDSENNPASIVRECGLRRSRQAYFKRTI